MASNSASATVFHGPRRAGGPVDQLRLVVAVHGFGQRVVVAVTHGADRTNGADLGESFPADGCELRSGVGLTTQAAQRISAQPPRQSDCLEHHRGAHVPGNAPPHDHPAEHADEEAELGHPVRQQSSITMTLNELVPRRRKVDTSCQQLLQGPCPPCLSERCTRHITTRGL